MVRPSRLFETPDADEPVRTERVISRLRVGMASAGLVAISIDPIQPAARAALAWVSIVSYAVASATLLAATPRTKQACGVARIAHAMDIVVAAALTLLGDGPNSPFFVFLAFPLLTAALRWGLRETLLSAAGALAALAGQAGLVEWAWPGPAELLAVPFSANHLIVLVTYLAIGSIGAGYFGDIQRQRRREADAVSELIRDARFSAGVAGALQSLLSALGRTFGATRALLIVQETESPRTYLLDMQVDEEAHGSATVCELDERGRRTYLFQAPGHSWYAPEPGWGGAPVTALDEHGRLIGDATVDLPKAFVGRHACRALLGVTVGIDAAWSGRLLLLDPHVGLDREEMVRFAQRLVRDIGPAVRQVGVAQRLRRRAERIERLRLARELHDGPVQTLNAAVLQLQLMRQGDAASATLRQDLAALEALLRDEISNIRDLTQDMRLGIIETDSPHFVHDLTALVDRFAHQHPIAAVCVSEVEAVAVASAVRHELLRIVHEALVNVRKHSGATEALVWLRVASDRLTISIEDNGRGFPFDGRLTHRELQTRGLGPLVILERVVALGGELTVESRPGHGVRLELRVPCAAESALARVG